MSLLHTKRFLLRLAQRTFKREGHLDRKEISRRLEKLKRLAHEKTPPLTIKKELLHLENQLHGVFRLEQKLQDEDKKEKAEIQTLKKQVTQLKRTLQLSQQQEVKKKVDKLSFLIGDLMARHETEREIQSKEIIQRAIEAQQQPELGPSVDEQITLFEQKLATLKAAGGVPEKQLALFQLRLAALKKKQLIQQPGEVKHRMLFGPQAAMP